MGAGRGSGLHLRCSNVPFLLPARHYHHEDDNGELDHDVIDDYGSHHRDEDHHEEVNADKMDKMVEET